MCSCQKHQNKKAECTCICPEHKNFDMAYDLAMRRYAEIDRLNLEITYLNRIINSLNS